MIKVLHFIHGLTVGGGESFIYTVLDSLKNTNIHFDIVIQNPRIENKKLYNLLKELGSKIYIIPDFRKNLIGHSKELKKILNKGYDYIHIHNNSLINPFPLIVSTHNKNVGSVILHSHNTSNRAGGYLGRLLHKINTSFFVKEKTIKLACGRDAGKWMFGNRDFTVICNAVDLDKFTFDIKHRNFIRDQYKINKDDFIIGHIGRFVPAKNHKFILNLFSELVHSSQIANCKLMLVGNGELKRKMIELAEKLNIDDKVIFTGMVENPEYFYSAFDCFILPSLHEGFAFVAVEAQAAGLYVLASDQNTDDINISEDVRFLPLGDQKKWIDTLNYYIRLNNRPTSINNKIALSDYNIKNFKKKISKIYGHE